MMGAEAAEAVVDEVTLLEAALREAMQRKRIVGGGSTGGAGGVEPQSFFAGSPMETTPAGVNPRGEVMREAYPVMYGGGQMGVPGFPGSAPASYGDQGLAAYGARLKAWIDMQVDARLNVVVPSLLERELCSFQQETGAAARMYQRLDGELELVKGAQAKILAVVEQFSEEIAQLKVQGEALAAVEKVMLTVEELQSSVSLRDRDPGYSDQITEIRDLHSSLRQTHEAGFGELRSSLDEMRRLHDSLHGRHDSSHADLLSRFSELSGRHEKHDTCVADLSLALADLRKLHNGLQESHHSGFAELHRLYGDSLSKTKGSSDELGEAASSMIAIRREVADLVAMMEEQEKGLAKWRSDITAEVSEELRAIGSLQEKSTGNRDLDSIRNELARDFERQQARLISELRVETSTAFRSEAAAVAALDEQLWLTDQRLGQRIDELAHSHREGISVVERRISSVLHNRLSPPLNARDGRNSGASSPLRAERHINVDGGLVTNAANGTLHIKPQPGYGSHATRTLSGRSLRASEDAGIEAQVEGEGAVGSGLRSNGLLRAIGGQRLLGMSDEEARLEIEERSGEEVRNKLEQEETSILGAIGTRRPLRPHIKTAP